MKVEKRGKRSRRLNGEGTEERELRDNESERPSERAKERRRSKGRSKRLLVVDTIHSCGGREQEEERA